MSCDKSTCSACDKNGCASHGRLPNETQEQYEARQRLADRMAAIRHKVLVLSGKGGVGKSTVAANLAVSLALEGHRVGLLDVDIHGPSIPKLMGLESYAAYAEDGCIVPAEVTANLRVMSIGFMLQDRDTALIWRGPMKIGVIQQFLRDTEWGDLDVLVVDCPPGTGDEPLSIVQMIGKADGAIIVTTPQQVATSDVRRSINFCHRLDLPVLGVIENMSGFVCPHCNEMTDIFSKGGGEAMAADMGVPFLGRIPIDPELMGAGDQGVPYVQRFSERPAAKAFSEAILPLIGRMGDTVASQVEA